MKALYAEYNRVLDLVSETIDRLDAAARGIVVGYDEDFHDGRPDAFVAWARANIPGAFSQTVYASELPKPRRIDPIESLDDLPDVLYHGSRDNDAVLTEGFRLPAATTIGNETYAWRARQRRDGWPINWAPYVRDWWKTISKAGRRSFEEQLGDKARRVDEVGDAISLLWTFDGPNAGYAQDGISLEIDPRKLPLIGYFTADEAGKGEHVLVLPADGWQGGPDAIVGVWKF